MANEQHTAGLVSVSPIHRVDELITKSRDGYSITESSPVLTAEPEVAVLYDADAPQSIPFRIQHEGSFHDITLVLGPQTDDLLFEYDKLQDIRLRNITEGHIKGIVPETHSSTAAGWLFDKVSQGVSGIGEPGEELPENWRYLEPITAELKEALITGAYLAIQEREPMAAGAGKVIKWGTPARNSTITLRALFSGTPVLLDHVFCPPSAAHKELYASVRKRAVITQGDAIGETDTRVPPSWEVLSGIYKEICREAKGYAGRVPVHHQVAAVVAFMDLDMKALIKK